MLVKLAKGGNGWDIKKEWNNANKIGRTASGKKCDIIVKLDSTAVSIDGIRRLLSQEYACCIRAKKTTAIEKPTICMNNIKLTKLASINWHICKSMMDKEIWRNKQILSLCGTVDHMHERTTYFRKYSKTHLLLS